MASVFMERTSSNGEKRHSILLSYKPKYIKEYEGNLSDPDFNEARQRENNKTLSYIAQELKNIKKEPKHNFEKLERDNQLEIISKKKRTIETILIEHGSFYQKETESLFSKFFKEIDEIYRPYLKRKN
jgi:hypothetical protein